MRHGTVWFKRVRLQSLRATIDWVNSSRLPPCTLIGRAVNRAMMHPAKRYREFVADLTTEGPRLHEPKMVRIRGFARADEAGLRCNKAEMVFVAVATRRANRKNTLVNAIGDARLQQSCALCEILPRLELQQHHPPIGRQLRQARKISTASVQKPTGVFRCRMSQSVPGWPGTDTVVASPKCRSRSWKAS